MDIQELEKPKFEWMVLLTVMMGTFLGRLDQTIVNLALPKIIDDFGITISAAGWIATAYIIANAVFVPIWGKLGDTLGRKKVYVIGFLVFILGSVLAGLAWNLGSMIAFRVIQAIAGSADYPTAMAIIAVTFKDEKMRAQALGIWSASFAAATVFGPLLGGPLIDTFGWRSVFLINLPVGLIGLGMALSYINESVTDRPSHNFDWYGAGALGGSLSALVLILDKGTDWGWTSLPLIILYAISIILFLIFIKIEQNHPEPIVDLKFFRNSTFVNTLFNNFIIFMGMMGSIFLIPIFAQTFLGYDATEAGYLFMPMAFAMMLGAPIGGRLMGKVSARNVIAASTAVAGIGLFMFSWIDPRSGALDIIIPLSIMAFGMGFGMAQRTNAIAAAVPQNEIGIASSILALARNVAGAFGIAVFGTILNSIIKSKIFAISENSILNIKTQKEYVEALGLMNLKAQVSAYDTVFLISASLVLIGAILAFAIKINKKDLDPNLKIHIES